MMTKFEPSQADAQLLHTIYEHLVDQAFVQMIIAIEELVRVDDPRAQELAQKIEVLSEQLMDHLDETLDQVPGLITREEADQKVTELLKQVALLNGMPDESLVPEKKILH